MHSKHELLKIQSACSHRAHDAERRKLRTLIVDILPPVSRPRPTVFHLYTNSPQVVFQTSSTLVQFITTNSVLVSCIFFLDDFSKCVPLPLFQSLLLWYIESFVSPSTPASSVRTSHLVHSGLANVCYH